jgi:lipid II:glycine glycyltransferase (peptidoglycan interpeptide bridge formation enzyme)
MELVTLTEKEYESFTSNHSQATFLNTIAWGKLKETMVGIMNYLVLKIIIK